MTTILLIRHAEKPDDQDQGVNELGVSDPESLIPRGWQRARALAVFFVAPQGPPTPDQIYVSAPDKEKIAAHVKIGSKSNRPLETMTPLAAKLNKVPVQTFSKGDEADLVDAVVKLDGTTLVCWQHESIPQIATLIMGTATAIPDPWPADRFDVVWRFTRGDAGKPWTFEQLCQRLLPGDGMDPIA
jgi:hypothetical protein